MIDSAPCRVRDVAEQLRGVSFERDEALAAPRDGYVPVLRAGNITEAGLTFDDLLWVPPSRVSPTQFLRPYDVVVAASSGSLGAVGKAAQLPSDWPGTFGAFCKVLRPRANVDPKYFGHFFRTRDYRRWVSSRAAGVNINNLRSSDLDDIVLHLPSLDEQRRIAAILDEADSLWKKRRNSLGALDQLETTLFLDKFRDCCTHNTMATVAGLIARSDHIRTGPFGSQLLHSEFEREGIAVLGIDNVVANEFRWVAGRCITEAKYRELQRYTVRAGDVLITIMGTCGRCAVVPDGLPTMINTKHLCCITLDRRRCLPEFLQAYFLWHPVAQSYLRRAARGAIMSGLNMTIIKELPVPLVPIADQREFVAARTAINRLRTSYRKAYEQTEELFGALQHRAFRGQL